MSAEPHSSGVSVPSRVPRRSARAERSTGSANAAQPAAEHRVVDVGDRLDDALVVGRKRHDARVVGALGHWPGELDDVRGEPTADLRDDRRDVGAAAVDLVEEQRRGHADASQGPPDHDGLRLHTLDGRQHQHGGVEHGERPLHLGDEVGVTGGVQEVDGQVPISKDVTAARMVMPRRARAPSSRCGSCPRRRCRARRARLPRRAGARSGWSCRRQHARRSRGSGRTGRHGAAPRWDGSGSGAWKLPARVCPSEKPSVTPASVTRGGSAVPLTFPARSSSATARGRCAALTGVIESTAERRDSPTAVLVRVGPSVTSHAGEPGGPMDSSGQA